MTLSRKPAPTDDALALTVGPPRPLPVAWDGAPVEWSPFRIPQVFICPPTPECCPTCGDTSPSAHAQGRVHHPTYPYAPPRMLCLSAYRCPGCGLDTVLDHATGEWWTLDDTDYGPEGSNPP